MITSSLTGNFGNHQFIYALTRTVAEKNGYEWGFNPTPEYDYYSGHPQMEFMEIDYGKQHNYTYHEIPEGFTRWDEKFETFHHVDKVDFQPFDPEVFNIKDNTKLYIRCAQDARYYNKEKLQEWFKIKEDYTLSYEQALIENEIDLNNDTCVINVRGGEYLGIPNVLLRNKYWEDSIAFMLRLNPKMNFLVVTDDVSYARSIFPFKVAHFGIGMDYYIINNAKNLILSNSSFAILPSWLNKNTPFIIAPKFWARHNVSNGYWASSDIWTFNFHFMSPEGALDNGL